MEQRSANRARDFGRAGRVTAGGLGQGIIQSSSGRCPCKTFEPLDHQTNPNPLFLSLPFLLPMLPHVTHARLPPASAAPSAAVSRGSRRCALMPSACRASSPLAPSSCFAAACPLRATAPTPLRVSSAAPPRMSSEKKLSVSGSTGEEKLFVPSSTF